MAEVHLPEEMIARIFERLPIKPLIRFTSLSKRWRFIILSDPKFAKSHFQIASQHRTLTSRLLVNKKEPKSESESHDNNLLFHEFESHDNKSSSSPPRKIPCRFSRPGFDTQMCSCNGLVSLLVSLKNIYIWNPSTGFYRTLPLISSEDEYVFHLGFGYVSSSDDYKIIACVAGPRSVDLVDRRNDYHILSLRTNVWKKMEVPPNIYIIGDSTLSNEASHWLLHDTTNIIAVFDLAREEFRTMQLPICTDPTFATYRGLRHLGASPGGNLCLLDYRPYGPLADFWVLKDYGVTDSWAKQFSFKISMMPYKLVLVMETSILVQEKKIRSGRWNFKWIKSGNEEEEEPVISMDISDYFGMIDYQETLLWLP